MNERTSQKSGIPSLTGYYKLVALTFFHLILIVLLLNGVCSVFFRFRDDYHRTYPIRPPYKAYLEPLYPSMTQDEIHDLWKETVGRPFQYEIFLQSREQPFRGRHVNVSREGFRYSHPQDPWPPQADHLNIFIFGGSTAFGYGVPDGETIASHLQNLMRQSWKQPVSVYNFGQGAYVAYQERLLFEKLAASGYRPQFAIFLDGLNEFVIEEPYFTESFRLLSEKPAFYPILASSLARLMRGVARRLNPPAEIDPTPVAKTVIQRYLLNKKLTELSASLFGVEPIFIWQPVPMYQYDLAYHRLAEKNLEKYKAFVTGKLGYALMENHVVGGDAGENFLWLGSIQKDEKKGLYVDSGHYSPEMSEKIATLIYHFLVAYRNNGTAPRTANSTRTVPIS